MRKISYSSFQFQINSKKRTEMELFKKDFPAGSEVVVRMSPDDGEVSVSVRTRRPNPVWLAQHQWRLGGGNSWVKVSEEQIRAGLRKLVAQDPGRGESHYCRLPLSQGGCGGSQDRKEQVLRDMIRIGDLRRLELNKPTGRRRFGIYPVEQETCQSDSVGL